MREKPLKGITIPSIQPVLESDSFFRIFKSKLENISNTKTSHVNIIW